MFLSLHFISFHFECWTHANFFHMEMDFCSFVSTTISTATLTTTINRKIFSKKKKKTKTKWVQLKKKWAEQVCAIIATIFISYFQSSLWNSYAFYPLVVKWPQEHSSGLLKTRESSRDGNSYGGASATITTLILTNQQ